VIELPADLRYYFGENDAFEAILNVKGKVFREHKNRKTVHIRKDGKGYFLKVHRAVGWREIFKNLFSLRLPVLGAQNEIRAIKRLEEIGVETMKMVGYGFRGMPPAWMESFLITEELEGTVSLEEFSREWKSNPPDFTLKLAIIKKVAEIARLLHKNGINHRDFYICHFLIDLKSLEEMSNEGLRMYLIDLHRVQLQEKVPQRWIIKDLAGLCFSSMDIGLNRRDILRFMKFYSGKPLRTSFREDSRFWELVKRRAVKLYEREFKRLPGLQI